MMWILFLALGGVVAWQLVLQTGAGAKRLECPACDLYITGARPGEGDSVLCPHCREFGVIAGGVQCGTPASRAVPIQLAYQQDASLGRSSSR